MLTLCFEACIGEIGRFGPSFSDLQLRFLVLLVIVRKGIAFLADLKVFPLVFLLFGARSHSLFAP